MKAQKTTTIAEALSETTIVSSNTITVPSKWNVTGNEKKVPFVVLKSKKDCESEGYVSGLYTFVNELPRSLAKARDKEGNVTSWEDVSEGAIVAICHPSYYRLFSSKKTRDTVLQYCIMRTFFEGGAVPSGFPNKEAAICSFMLAEGVKPSAIIRAMKHVNGRTAKECLRYLKHYKADTEVSMAGAVDDSDAADASEPKKADSTPAADAAAQSA